MLSKGKFGDITKLIIGGFYTVHRTLGYGFKEHVYENSLAIELKNLGLKVDQQKPILVHYNGTVVGEFYADLVVNDKVVVELKAVSEMIPQHEAQLLNYLKSSTYEVGLLMNFGKRAKFKRLAMDNQNKGSLVWL